MLTKNFILCKKTDNRVSFKKRFTFAHRIKESARIMKKYAGRVPIICERANTSDVELINKNKYLVPIDLTLGQFVFVIRRRLKLDPAQAIFLFINNIIPPTAALFMTLYDEYKEDDGFLYIKYSGENTFGN